LREVLERHDPDEALIAAILLRPVPVAFLDHVARTEPWSERPMLLARVAANRKTPRHVALSLVPALFWRDLAVLAGNPAVSGAIRMRCEERLRELLGELRLGERIALARMATSPLLTLLLTEGDSRIHEACLGNPRLREADLVTFLGRPEVKRALLEAVAASARWSERYAVRLALALQPRTPLALVLSQLSSLNPGDLRRLVGEASVAPLVRAAAQEVLDGRGAGGPNPRGSDT
jgi:hypothetical protein